MASDFCTNCGARLNGSAFCPGCGTKAPTGAAQQPAYTPPPAQQPAYNQSSVRPTPQQAPEYTQPPVYSQPAYSPPPAQQPVYAPPPVYSQPAYSPPPYQPPRPADDPPAKGSRYDMMSTGGFIGAILLMCIPVVGFILMIVWACGGCKKQAKRNLARGMLIFIVVFALIIALLGVVFVSSLKNLADDLGVSDYLDPDWVESSGLLSGMTCLVCGDADTGGFAPGSTSLAAGAA